MEGLGHIWGLLSPKTEERERSHEITIGIISSVLGSEIKGKDIKAGVWWSVCILNSHNFPLTPQEPFPAPAPAGLVGCRSKEVTRSQTGCLDSLGKRRKLLASRKRDQRERG